MTKKIRGASYRTVRVGGGRIHTNGRKRPVSHAERQEAWKQMRELFEKAQEERVRVVTYEEMKDEIKQNQRTANWISAVVYITAFVLTATFVIILVTIGTL